MAPSNQSQPSREENTAATNGQPPRQGGGSVPTSGDTSQTTNPNDNSSTSRDSADNSRAIIYVNDIEGDPSASQADVNALYHRSEDGHGDSK